MNAVVRAFDAVIDDVDIARRSVVARINTSNVDRYNTVILARGARTKDWRRAGAPVLWEHGKHPERFTDPIANSPKLWNNGGPLPTEIVAEPIFLEDDFSQRRFEWYRDGKVKGWSVNILPDPKGAGPPTKEELRSRPDWEGATTIYRDWDLAEFSGTVIPGNADALTSDRAAAVMELVDRSGLWLPDEARPLYEAAMARGRTINISDFQGEGPALVPVVRYITHSGDKWIVHAEDGKVLGEHDSEEGAKKQLAAIEAHKHQDKDKDERSAPYYEADADGRSWTVYAAGGVPIAHFADEKTARHCLIILATPAVPIERQYFELNREIRSDLGAFREHIVALVDLYRYGRI